MCIRDSNTTNKIITSYTSGFPPITSTPCLKKYLKTIGVTTVLDVYKRQLSYYFWMTRNRPEKGSTIKQVTRTIFDKEDYFYKLLSRECWSKKYGATTSKKYTLFQHKYCYQKFCNTRIKFQRPRVVVHGMMVSLRDWACCIAETRMYRTQHLSLIHI